MNRREFVEAAVATGAALSMGTAHTRDSIASMSGLCVLFDARYSDARSFADASRTLGASVLSGSRDAVELWRTVLRSTTRPHAIAGLTVHSDLEILQSCAMEIGLKLRREIFHDCRGRSSVQHRIARGATPSLVRELTVAGTAWPSALARVLAAPDIANGAPMSIADSQAPKAADHPGTLVSWLLA